MSQLNRLFKTFAFFLCLGFIGVSAFSAETPLPHQSKRESSLYRDINDQNIYNAGVQYLYFGRLYRGLFHIRKRALDVNVFDEVPDSDFFVNRHSRSRMSSEEIKRGPSVTSGPDLSGPWTIYKGKFDGITPGFFIKDSKGDKYLLKFDPVEAIEAGTGAEVISSRLMYALGYNVPQYTLVNFKKEQLTVAPGAVIYDDTGFRKKLTPEGLEEFLLFIPQTKDGFYRASASLILKGKILGPMKFQGRRSKDPEDLIDHEDRREIRALQVISSWINNNDVRESNSLDVIEEKEGRPFIRHYLIDFNSSLGATPRGPKPPQFGHEHMIDYSETLKAFLTLGLVKKPWQKRWDETNREVPASAAGYFDNRYFSPGKYKTQLPHFAFKDLTRADAFWAAKMIMTFTDEEIRAAVSTGEFSDPKVSEEIAKTLIERRNLIGRYWFDQANPLDQFKWAGSAGSYELQFEDLAVRYGFAKDGTGTYRFEVREGDGKKARRIAEEENAEERLPISPEWLKDHSSLDILIRTRRPDAKTWSPPVLVKIKNNSEGPHLAGVVHQD